jgi:hypothetical protein
VALILRHRFGVDVVEPLHEIRVAPRLLHRPGQLLDDVVGRSLWCVDAVPGADPRHRDPVRDDVLEILKAELPRYPREA